MLAGVNWMAYQHAYAMSHFVHGGEKTARPEELSWLGKAKVLLTGVRLPRPTNSTTPAAIGLEFETWSFETDDGVTLESWLIPAAAMDERAAKGRGMALLFHGYGASKSSQLPAARILHDLGYECLLVDFRGSGGSAGDTTTLGYYEALDVAACVAFARKLKPDQPVIVLGTSMGAAATLRAVATQNVDVDAILLESPFDDMLATVGNRFGRMGLPPFPMAQLLVYWGGYQQGYDAFTHNPAEYASKVHIPTLHIHGENDTNVTQPQAKRLFEALSGPKEYYCVQEAGHECYATHSMAEWKVKVDAFLKAHLQETE